MANERNDPIGVNNVAIGTDRIYLDGSQGTGGWTTQLMLPGLTGSVSAIHYVSPTLIYAGSTTGQVYKLLKTGATWAAMLISAAPLPSRYIWDISALPGTPNTVVLGMSGFGSPHVWKGIVPATGAAAWTNVSGALPDIPVNAVAVDTATTYYIATDVAVYRTTNGGTNWTPFSDGLPNCAVFDLKLHGPSRLLRAATHGRGMLHFVVFRPRTVVSKRYNVDLSVGRTYGLANLSKGLFVMRVMATGNNQNRPVRVLRVPGFF